VPCLLHIGFAQLTKARLHPIAGRERQVIKCPEVREEVTNVLLVTQINRVALRPFGKARPLGRRATARSTFSRLLEATTMAAPSLAAISAVAKPIPDVPPSTTILFPFKVLGYWPNPNIHATKGKIVIFQL
jgi:hypothetical protein